MKLDPRIQDDDEVVYTIRTKEDLSKAFEEMKWRMESVLRRVRLEAKDIFFWRSDTKNLYYVRFLFRDYKTALSAYGAVCATAVEKSIPEGVTVKIERLGSNERLPADNREIVVPE